MGRLLHHWRHIILQRREQRDEALILAVARCDAGIADHTIAPNTLDWRSRENLAKACIIQLQQIGDTRRDQFSAG